MTKIELIDLLNYSAKKFVSWQAYIPPFTVDETDMNINGKSFSIYIDVNEIREYRLLKLTKELEDNLLNAWFHEILYKMIYKNIPKGYNLTFYYKPFNEVADFDDLPNYSIKSNRLWDINEGGKQLFSSIYKFNS